MALNFGEWVVKVAVNGVKAGSFDREWAALQLANHYVRGKITELDLVSFETAVDEYEAERAADLIEEETEISSAAESGSKE